MLDLIYIYVENTPPPIKVISKTLLSCVKMSCVNARINLYWYSKTCVKRPLPKRTKNGFQDQLSLNAVQKNCRMLQGEHSAILLTFIKLPFSITTFIFSIFKSPLYTDFTVFYKNFVSILIKFLHYNHCHTVYLIALYSIIMLIDVFEI